MRNHNFQKLKKFTTILLIAVVLIVIVCIAMRNKKVTEPDFCIAYIGKNRIDQKVLEKNKSILYPYLEDIDNNGEIDIEFMVLQITPGKNELVNSQQVLSQLLGGSSVLYIADMDIITGAVDDENLFLPIGDEPYVSAENSKLLGDLGIDTTGMSVFIRSTNVKDDELGAFIKARQPMAIKLFEAITG